MTKISLIVSGAYEYAFNGTAKKILRFEWNVSQINWHWKCLSLTCVGGLVWFGCDEFEGLPLNVKWSKLQKEMISSRKFLSSSTARNSSQ